MPDSVNFRRFPKGVDNRRQNEDMAAGALRMGVNVDILNSGLARRRRGISQVVDLPGSHSVFTDGVRMVCATATTLELFTASLARTTVLTDARLRKPVSFLALHGEIYFSNEDINGKIDQNGRYQPWGIQPPAVAPTVSSGGNRFTQVTCTFVTATGEESGAPLAVACACSDEPLLSVTNIPQSADARVVATRLYVADLDGTVLYAQVDVPAGVTSYVIRGPFGAGKQLDTQFMVPPPPGQAIEYDGNGHILIACGNAVLNTQALRYGLFDPTVDYVQYPERVTLLKAVEDGFYTSAVDTRFVTGLGAGELGNRPVFPYRAIEGSAMSLPNSKDVMWLSERGVIRAGAGGQARNITESQVVMTRYTRAAMGIFEYNGHKAAIAVTQGGTPSPEVAKDYIEAEATRTAELE